MSKTTNYIWTVTHRDRNDANEIIETVNHYNQITKIKRFVHLLICAGYNETFRCDTEHLYQIWRRDTTSFTIERFRPNVDTLSHLL